MARSVLMMGNQLYDGRTVDAGGTDVTVVVDVAVTVSMSVDVVADGVTVTVERVVVKSRKTLVETEGSVCVSVDTRCVPVNGSTPYRVSDRVVTPVTAVSLAKFCVEEVVAFRAVVAVASSVDVVSYKTKETVKSCAKTVGTTAMAAAKNLTNILQDV
jgi:hypothetical protein